MKGVFNYHIYLINVAFIYFLIVAVISQEEPNQRYSDLGKLDGCDGGGGGSRAGCVDTS